MRMGDEWQLGREGEGRGEEGRGLLGTWEEEEGYRRRRESGKVSGSNQVIKRCQEAQL